MYKNNNIENKEGTLKCEVSCIKEAKNIFFLIEEISIRLAKTMSILSQTTKIS